MPRINSPLTVRIFLCGAAIYFLCCYLDCTEPNRHDICNEISYCDLACESNLIVIVFLCRYLVRIIDIVMLFSAFL